MRRSARNPSRNVRDSKEKGGPRLKNRGSFVRIEPGGFFGLPIREMLLSCVHGECP